MEEKDRMSNEKATSRLLMVLATHVGEENAIDMGELYSRVFKCDYNHKINNTRRLRTIITALRHKAIPIGSRAATTGGGYYLVRAGSELDSYCRRIHRAALNKLEIEAKLRKLAMPELLGQMRIALEGESHDISTG